MSGEDSSCAASDGRRSGSPHSTQCSHGIRDPEPESPEELPAAAELLWVASVLPHTHLRALTQALGQESSPKMRKALQQLCLEHKGELEQLLPPPQHRTGGGGREVIEESTAAASKAWNQTTNIAHSPRERPV